RITDQIKSLLRQLTQEMGIVMPAFRTLDNIPMRANEYRIPAKEADSGKGELFPDSFLIIDLKPLPIDLPATHTTTPACGLTVTGVQRVLQTLLAERVSIRDLPAILEGIAEAVGHTKNALYITEHVRARLARQLCHANLSPAGYLPLLAMSPAWEQAFAEAIV